MWGTIVNAFRWDFTPLTSVIKPVSETKGIAMHSLFVCKVKGFISNVLKFFFSGMHIMSSNESSNYTFISEQSVIKVKMFTWWETLGCITEYRWEQHLLQTSVLEIKQSECVFLFVSLQVPGIMNLFDVLSPCQLEPQVEAYLNPLVRRWPLLTKPNSTGWVMWINVPI